MNIKNLRDIITDKTTETSLNNITLEEVEKEIRNYMYKKTQMENIEGKDKLESLISIYINENINKWKIDSFLNKDGKMDKGKLIQIVIDDLLNFGPLQEVLYDPNITEIQGLGRWIIVVDSKGKSQYLYNSLGERAKWSSREDQLTILNKLFEGDGQLVVNNEFKLVNGRTVQGFRLSVTHSTATSISIKDEENGYCDFTLRKFKDSWIPIEDLIRSGTLSDDMGKLLIFMVGNLSYAIIGATGSGKAQPLDSLILTPSGYKLMKNIKIGDEIFDSNGNITEVLNIFPQGKRECFDIIFEDNTKISVSDNHLNSVLNWEENKGYIKKIIETNELIHNYDDTYIEYWTNDKFEQKLKRKIKSIKSIGPQECQCIYIKSDIHEYITNNFTITHNTTLNRSLLNYIPPMTRTICIQQPTEIDLRKYNEKGELINNRVMWEASEDAKDSKDGSPLKYTNTLNNLMTQTLRNTPKIISVNEVRHPDECQSAVLIGQAGHIVNLTFHAEDPEQGCKIFTNKVISVSNQSYEVGLMDTTATFKFMICQNLLKDGSRKITKISEICGVDPDHPTKPKINDIYEYVVDGRKKNHKGEIIEIIGHHEKVGNLSKELRKRLSIEGIVEEDLKILDPDYESKPKQTYMGKVGQNFV